MQHGLISHAAIAASSTPTHNSPNQGPELGRLHKIVGGSSKVGSWQPASNNEYQWLQVDMGDWARITGVATQGRQDYNYWVKSYSLSTSTGVFFEFVKTDSGVKKVCH